MPLTPYKHLKKITNNTGSFPTDLTPGDEVQFKYEYECDFNEQFGLFNSVQIPLEVRMEMRGPPITPGGADGDLILSWGFKVSYQLTTLFVLYTYYAFGQKVTVTFPVPPPAILGSPDGIAEPGGGDGYGLGDLNFQEAFESPIFKIKVPPGSTVKITFHTAGFPALISLASLSVRTRKTGAVDGFITGFRHAQDGEATLLYSGAKTAQQARLSARRRLTVEDNPLDWGVTGGAALLKTPGGVTQTALYQKDKDVVRRIALDDGVRYTDPVELFPDKIFVGAVKAAGQIIVLLADSTGAGYVAYIGRKGSVSDPAPVSLPAGTKWGAFGVLLYEGGVMDFAYPGDKGGMEHFVSRNDGKDWV